MNYFSHAIRNLSKNKLISFVNIFGLSVSITLATLLIVYIKFELSYDKFHIKHDRIYRILTKSTKPGENPELLAICQGRLPGIIKDIPEIEHCARVYRSQCDIEANNRRYTSNPMIYADSTFFEIFSFRLLQGNPENILDDPHNVILSRSLALKIFNTLDITGKTVKCENTDYTIMGVLEDVPSDSHLQFQVICGFKPSQLKMLVEHSGLEFLTYVLLKPNTDHIAALDKISGMYGKYLSAFWKDTGSEFAGVPQRLEDIELHSGNVVWDVPHGNLKNIWIATGLIAFILIIAVMNFINLETVAAESRLKDIAMRKIAGASRLDMINLYMGETIFTAVISGLLALMFLVSFSWPLTAVFTGKEIPDSLLFSPSIIASILILCLLIGLVAGTYPAVYLSRFSVTKVMKDTSLKGIKTNSLIRWLVLAQFIIVVFLVSALMIFYRQVQFIKDKDLGFDKEYVVDIHGLTSAVCKSYQSVKQELLRSEIIENVCLAQGINVDDLSGQYASAAGSGLKPGLVRHTRTSHGFVKTFRLNVLSGRDFESTMATDRKSYMINETAAKFLGFKGDPVGKPIVMYDTGMVIGVVKDFNFASLHNEIEPLLITLEQLSWGHLYVRLKSSHIQDGLDLISRTIKSVDPMYSLEYEFVDDIFTSMYADEKKMSKFLFISTFLSILLAFMGLMALTSLTILRRVKEIGIRKINGSRTNEVLILLNREYAGLIICSVLIGIPLSWFVMGNWLKGYAFTAGMPWWIFVLSGLIALSVSLLTVTLISWRAATRNPVESLRYE